MLGTDYKSVPARELIKINKEEGEDAAIKALEDIIQKEKDKMADLGFKAIIATIDTIAENRQKTFFEKSKASFFFYSKF